MSGFLSGCQKIEHDQKRQTSMLGVRASLQTGVRPGWGKKFKLAGQKREHVKKEKNKRGEGGRLGRYKELSKAVRVLGKKSKKEGGQSMIEGVVGESPLRREKRQGARSEYE